MLTTRTQIDRCLYVRSFWGQIEIRVGFGDIRFECVFLNVIGARIPIHRQSLFFLNCRMEN